VERMMENDITIRNQDRIVRLEKGHERMQERIETLDRDITEIKSALSHMPTKLDLYRLREHMDQGINVVLRDALNTVPAKAMVTWTIVLAILAAIPYIIHLLGK
jgi:succinate dehydrogenase hydrophobic anchor subunit